MRPFDTEPPLADGALRHRLHPLLDRSRARLSALRRQLLLDYGDFEIRLAAAEDLGAETEPLAGKDG